MKYVDLFVEHDDLVSDKWEQYFYEYQELFKKYLDKNKPLNILEIGVQNGGSLQIWKKFLPAGSKIYGVDVNANCKNLNFGEDIQVYIGNASTKEFWADNLQDVTFDVILDDGSHLCKEVIDTFETIFTTKLNIGGTYIIEDLQTSYWKDYQGGFRTKNSSMEYFKNLTDSLNINYLEFPRFFDKKQAQQLKELNKQIKRISFYDAMCSIEKYNVELKRPFERLLTGKYPNIYVAPDFNELKVENNMDKIEEVRKHCEI